MNKNTMLSTETATTFLTQDLYMVDGVPLANSKNRELNASFMVKLFFFMFVFINSYGFYMYLTGGY